MRRRLLLTSLLLVLFALGALGASALFAATTNPAPRIDRAEALRALAVLNTYFEQGAVATPTAVPTPRPTPTRVPTPIPTPTSVPATPTAVPVPAPLPVLDGCRIRKHGAFYGHGQAPSHTVVEQASSHIDVTFINPNYREWAYGFVFNETLTIEVTHEGKWIKKTGPPSVYGSGYRTPTRTILSSGWLNEGGVSFNTGAGERNQLTSLITSPWPGISRYIYLVNGVEIRDLRTAGGTPSKYSNDRKYGLISTAYLQNYENLCAVESWR